MHFATKTMRLGVMAVSLFAGGCGTTKLALGSNNAIPAAQGSVAASRTKNSNTALDVRVQHLALPAKVEPGATTYVVWARPQFEGNLQNLGALTVDGNLNGQLKTVTPFRDFELFITAEPVAAVGAPTGDQLLSVVVRR